METDSVLTSRTPLPFFRWINIATCILTGLSQQLQGYWDALLIKQKNVARRQIYILEFEVFLAKACIKEILETWRCWLIQYRRFRSRQDAIHSDSRNLNFDIMLSFEIFFYCSIHYPWYACDPPPLIFYVFVARIESTNDPHLSQTLLFFNENKNHSSIR